MRKKVLAANWKMNLLKNEALDLYDSLNKNLLNFQGINIVLFPPSIYISELQSKGSLSLGIQNIYFQNRGAFKLFFDKREMFFFCSNFQRFSARKNDF